VRKSFRFVLSAMLTGGLVTIANAQTGSPQKKSIPPSLMKDCTAHLVEADPRIKIVGRYAPAQQANIFGSWTSQLADQLGIVIIAAPAKYPNSKSWAGCIYDPEDKAKPNEGKLVFRKVIREFPRRTKLEPGEAP
jgi:hypothetical protein